jgi:hypothetical protein
MNTKNTSLNNPEESQIYTSRRENLKSHGSFELAIRDRSKSKDTGHVLTSVFRFPVVEVTFINHHFFLSPRLSIWPAVNFAVSELEVDPRRTALTRTRGTLARL